MESIAQGKIERAERVRDLQKIIDDPEAYEAFISEGSRAAMNKLSDKDPAVGSMTYKQISKTLKAIQSFPRSELLDTVRNKSKLQLLEKLHTELEGLINDIKSAGRVS